MPAAKKEAARASRKKPTPSEARLWERLRCKQLGYVFRRQSCVRGYIADFYCPALRIIVEVDGGYHRDRAAYDARRDQHLAAVGIATVRVTADEVMDNTDRTVSIIEAALRERTRHLRAS